jgi:hypothetical protein
MKNENEPLMDWRNSLATNIVYVERELGYHIGPNFPYFILMHRIEELSHIMKKYPKGV